jgi:outer membrane protein assembly factor BamD (BamD/ComL family)
MYPVNEMTSLSCAPSIGRAVARLIGIGLMTLWSGAAMVAAGSDDGSANRLYSRAQQALTDGEPEAALERFRAIVDRHPQTHWSAMSLWEIFRIQTYLGEAEAAFEALDMLIVKQPGHFAKAHEEQFRLVQRLLGAGPEARRTLERVRQSQKIDPDLLTGMLRRVIRHGPESEIGIQAHYLLAMATEKAGRKDEAAALYADFVENHAKHELGDDAAYQSAYILYKDWQAGKSDSPRDREKAAVALAYFLARFPQSDKAALARACLNETRSSELRELRSLARYYAARGNEKAAAVYYEQLALKFPGVVVRDRELRREIIGDPDERLAPVKPSR